MMHRTFTWLAILTATLIGLLVLFVNIMTFRQPQLIHYPEGVWAGFAESAVYALIAIATRER